MRNFCKIRRRGSTGPRVQAALTIRKVLIISSTVDSFLLVLRAACKILLWVRILIKEPTVDPRRYRIETKRAREENKEN